jgi:hypothetical protein
MLLTYGCSKEKKKILKKKKEIKNEIHEGEIKVDIKKQFSSISHKRMSFCQIIC